MERRQCRNPWHSEALVAQIQDFLVSGVLTDVAVSVIEDQTLYTIRCHRVVLSSASPLLHEALSANISSESEVNVFLSDTSNHQLEHLISYLYTGAVTFDDQSHFDAFRQLCSSLGIATGLSQRELVPCPVAAPTPAAAASLASDGKMTTVSHDGCGSGSESPSVISTVDHSAILYSLCEEGEKAAEQVEQQQRPDLLHDNNLIEAVNGIDSTSSIGSCHSSTVSSPSSSHKENDDDDDDDDDGLLSSSDSAGDAHVKSAKLAEEQSRRKKQRRKSSSEGHECRFCSKRFPSQYYLRFHENCVHSKTKTYVCSQCDKVFSGEYYLRQHCRRMHSESRPFACPQCKSSFSVKYDLVVHLRTHAAVKPYACPQPNCGKTCATQRALREHVRTHTGERPYKCSDCGKAFALAKTLRVHYRQHSGERPYLCSHCGMTFVQNSTLKNHLKHNHVLRDKQQSR